MRKDAIVGRPIRLNRQTLKVKRGKNYAEVLFFSDLHLGHPQCRLDLAKKNLDYCLHNGIYVHCLGDAIEAGTTTSVGDSVYQQHLNPQEQMEAVIELLEPLAKAGLITGFHNGNHETRILKTTSVDPGKWMAKALGVPFLGYACWNLFRVGNQNYTLYTHHGYSGARFKHSKMKVVVDLAANFHGDVVAIGHVHDLATEKIIKQRVDLRSKTVVSEKTYLMITGSYIDYDRSYAQMLGLPPTVLGSPKAKFLSDRHDVHVSL